ncbi:hypothetical protein JKF63_02290 [Porcisia hertigi]|uniref:Uncharacterized protein n=1 Tax=Porcisia hertigi TaxID=2761500 RepID=A0A836IH16_9TRYP|nr:hypothetical protein JKF63_02290 [Porcisia hertigi]
MRSSGRKRCHSGSCSPPLQDGYALDNDGRGALSIASPEQFPDPALFASCGLLRNRQAHRCYSGLAGTPAGDAYVLQQSLPHLQTIQDLLRRTSLAEMRDREVVEYLIGADRWLRELNRPLVALGSSSNSSDTSLSARGLTASMEVDTLISTYRSALSELRLLVLGVLHTMPWWRVVETVAGNSAGAPLRGPGEASASGDGHAGSGPGCAGAPTRRPRGSNRSVTAAHAVARWHVRLQIAFERVCLTLIDQSQQTVRGVLEVLLKPCQLRLPVRDCARRSIPSDSVIRVLNAVATKYSPNYVVELLEGCSADFMPRRRWAERRHHVACTAVLLYVALEGQTPAYHPHLGNSQSLQRAVELLKALRPRYVEGRGSVGGFPSLPPRATCSSSPAIAGGTSEESGTDAGGWSSPTSPQHERRHALLSSMLPNTGVLPSGYVSATILEGARVGETALLQPTLPHPFPFSGSLSLVETTTTASDTELSDADARGRGRASSGVNGGLAAGQGRHYTRVCGGGVGEGSDSSAAAAAGVGGRSAAGVAGRLSGEGSSAAVVVPSSTGASGTPSFLDVTVEHNNKLLSYRNDIVRILLNRLLDVEVTLEFQDGEDQHTGCSRLGGVYGLGNGGSTSMMIPQARRASINGSPYGSPGTTGLGSPAAISAQTSSFSGSGGSSVLRAFPCDPITAAGAGRVHPGTAASAFSSPAPLSPAALSHQCTGTLGCSSEADLADWNSAALTGASRASAPPLERLFNTLSQPYLRTLRDCATLVYGRLADDLRRQQVAGSCGNADWWTDMLFFYLHVVTRVERPVYLLYLAPSLSMLGTEDESIGLLHKLITLVTKGSMPVEQPRSSTRSATAAFGRSATAFSGGASSSLLTAAPVQPVRLRMAPPTGASRRYVTMEERLRAARHIFPLFRFLKGHIDEASGEGVRRRLLKWTAQELRRLHDSGGGPFASSMGSSAGSDGGLYTHSRLPFFREARLALVTFAHCAAISELMGVDVAPQLRDSDKSARESTRFTSSTANGDTFDSIAAALEPLLNRYTLQSEPRAEQVAEEENKGDGTGLTTPSNRGDMEPLHSRRRIDLRQMEFEGLLQPNLMAYCPWQAWLR